MAYSKDEIKKITDKVLNMCKADAVEVRFSGGERSATRFANSSITANLIEQQAGTPASPAPAEEPEGEAEPLAQLGVAPGKAEANEAAPTPPPAQRTQQR